MTESFPRQQALTQAFSLGVPRSFTISPDGWRVAFLRSQGGRDPVTCLWLLDVATGTQRLLADPATLAAGGAAPEGELTDQERALRERTRERSSGITRYATDSGLTVATFALAGQVWLADLAGDAGVRPLPATTPAFDPRPDPTGRRVAYACQGALRVTELATGTDREVIGPAGRPGLTFGLAEFIAAEEMGRTRGYWWAPDGNALAVARVDESPVGRWYIADPANPADPPRAIAYPAAGTANADVSLLVVELGGNAAGPGGERGPGGTVAELAWDRALFPYLVNVSWDDHGLLVAVQSRDQRRLRLLWGEPGSTTLTVIREETDQHWVDIVPGTPAWTRDGRIAWATDSGDAKRLLAAAPAGLAAASPVTPPGLQVREVLATDGDAVLFTASREEPTETGVWLHRPQELSEVSPAGGVHTGRRAGGTTVLVSRGLAGPGVTAQAIRGQAATGIASLAERPALPPPRPQIFAAGPSGIRTALLLPSWHRPGSGTLPVLLDPYGGPHFQKVVAACDAYLTSQWFAEQGFAVVVADGRGTPGRGPAWDRAVAGDLAGPVLDDQVTALHAAAERCADLDLGRVGIRGWSFGGHLAALAVLRRPDVFHAAVAGAPVTDQRLYDTHYTERYLGQPGRNPAAYQRSSVISDAQRLRATAQPHRPLMLIHGLADDNVVAAHTLRLSAALLAAGYPHTVLPLTGITHLAAQPEVAENLLLVQADFLRRALGVASLTPAGSPAAASQ
jgi:dipeptidyl-peptidase-4